MTRKGGKAATIPLAPAPPGRSSWPPGERSEGPIFPAGDGRRMDRHGARRIARKAARRAEITKPAGPHTLRQRFITAAQRRGIASDAIFRVRREDGAVRDGSPGTAGRRSRRQSEAAGQDGRDRTRVASGARMLRPLWLHQTQA